MKYYSESQRRWKSVSPPCTCGGCETCYPGQFDDDRPVRECFDCGMTRHDLSCDETCGDCSAPYPVLMAGFSEEKFLYANYVNSLEEFFDLAAEDTGVSKETLRARWKVRGVEYREGWDDWSAENQPEGGVISLVDDCSEWAQVARENPVFSEPGFREACGKWERFKDLVETTHPSLRIVGLLMQGSS